MDKKAITSIGKFMNSKTYSIVYTINDDLVRYFAKMTADCRDSAKASLIKQTAKAGLTIKIVSCRSITQKKELLS